MYGALFSERPLWRERDSRVHGGPRLERRLNADVLGWPGGNPKPPDPESPVKVSVFRNPRRHSSYTDEGSQTFCSGERDE